MYGSSGSELVCRLCESVNHAFHNQVVEFFLVAAEVGGVGQAEKSLIFQLSPVGPASGLSKHVVSKSNLRQALPSIIISTIYEEIILQPLIISWTRTPFYQYFS